MQPPRCHSLRFLPGTERNSRGKEGWPERASKNSSTFCNSLPNYRPTAPSLQRVQPSKVDLGGRIEDQILERRDLPALSACRGMRVINHSFAGEELQRRLTAPHLAFCGMAWSGKFTKPLQPPSLFKAAFTRIRQCERQRALATEGRGVTVWTLTGGRVFSALAD